jgi:hypothetical protein
MTDEGLARLKSELEASPAHLTYSSIAYFLVDAQESNEEDIMLAGTTESSQEEQGD